MVHNCVVRDCGSSWYPGCQVKYHGFPKDDTRRNLWLTKVPLKSKFYPSSRICSLHFNEEDYDCTGKYLKPTAVPFYFDETLSSNMEEESNVEGSAPMVPPTSPGSDTSISGKSSCDEPTFTVIDLDKLCTGSKTCKSIHFLKEASEKHTISDVEVQMCQKNVCFIVQEEPSNMDDEYKPSPKTHKAVQVNIKTQREKELIKKVKYLKEKVSRQSTKISNMKSLISVVKDYTSHSEIDNIIEGRFSDLCKNFKTPLQNPHGIRYSGNLKAFAHTLNLISPEAYKFLRNYTALPPDHTLRRSTVVIEMNDEEYLEENENLP